MSLKDLEEVPNGPAIEGSKAANSVLFVDYDLLHLDKTNGRFYGNWRNTAEEACKDKTVNSYVDRAKFLDHEFVSDCPLSKMGIWIFTILP
ncbi:hypothetical protein [Bradyrhizobium sp. LA7.1]|uniref:hypothetical protein n=1 Tax=Bradyrhizobium sp. LA7.1 TaxID=3156324 RepID=UPI0033909617